MAEPRASGKLESERGRPAAVWFLLRFLVWAAALGLPGLYLAEPVAGALLPLLRAEIAWLDDTFRIDRLVVELDGSDHVVRIEVGLARSFTLNGLTFHPDARGKATASTLIGNVLLPCVLLASVAFAWPLRSPWSAVVRALAVPACALVLCLVCAPVILLAAVRCLR